MGVQLRDASTTVIPTPRRMIPRVSPASVRLALGGSADLSKRNLFNPDTPASVLGSPAYSASPYFASLQGNTHYLDTGILGADALTVYAVVRAPAIAAANLPAFFGNLDATNKVGFGLYVAGASSPPAGQIRFGSYFTDTTNTLAYASLTVTDLTAWALYVGQAQGGVGLKLWNRTTSQSSTVADARTRAVGPTQTIKAGGCVGTSGGTGTHDLALFDYYPAAHTDVQMTQIIADIRALMLARGITV